MIFETKIDVRFPDCDSMGIVHHAVYPIYYEAGRIDFFEKCGFGFTASRALGIDPAMVNLELNYGMPLTYPQTITVRTICTLLQGKKLGFSYEIYADSSDKPVSTAKSFHIWVKDGKSINIEQEVPEMFNAYKTGLTK